MINTDVSSYNRREKNIFHNVKSAVSKDIYLYLLLIIPVIHFLLFAYAPMLGSVIAFRKYVPGQNVYGVQWVGLKYFKLFLEDPTFWRAFKNNLILAFLNIGFGFPIPILFALLLNELRNKMFKKIVQTVSYLPRFISLVVVVGMIKQVLSPTGGVVNTVLQSLGTEPIFFINRPEWFRTIYVTSGIWMYMGWSTIIYIAALTNINAELYESSSIDGAGRFKQAIHITFPGIMPAIIINLILQVGRMIDIGYEKIILLYNPMTYETADIISTLVYRMGIEKTSYSYATAIGLFNSVISLILVYMTNMFAKKVSDTSLW